MPMKGREAEEGRALSGRGAKKDLRGKRPRNKSGDVP